MKGLTLNEREQARLEVLNRVLQRQLSVGEAMQILGVSERHAWRILAAYRKEGAAALAHGNRGRRPANAISAETKGQVVGLAQARYEGLNHTHLMEKLAEWEGITLARTTVRNMLVSAGVNSPRHRRPPRHRVRRERLPQEGMLLQIDGSDHEWLQGRGPRLTLLLAIDDATGTAPWALFHKEEDAVGYFLLLQGITQCKGVPLALYSDRHAVFRTHERAGGPGELTQFGRAMQELGVAQVFALSPQAKGRIERANGTFQDRLVAELRLAGASTETEANRVLWDYLPRYSDRFGVPSAQPGCAYRPVGQDLDLKGILCFKYQRKVARDNTVKFRWRTLQLLPAMERSTYAGVQVEVQERLDGSLVICHDGRVVPSQEAPPRPSVLRDRARIDNGKNISIPGYLTNGVSPVPGGQGSGGGMGGADSEGLHQAAYPEATTRRTASAVKTPAARLDQPRRPPTPKQQARWAAVQEAMLQGLSLRGIARTLGIARDTVRKCADAEGPITYPTHRTAAIVNDDEVYDNPDNEAHGDKITELLTVTY